MTNLVRWDPFRETVSLRDAMDRLFEESFVRPRTWLAPNGVEGNLALDVFEDAESVVVKASIPGVKPEEIQISVTGDTLTIKGETREEKEEKDGTYHMRERRYGAFHRAMTLPTQVSADDASAEFENGVLTLTLPKAEEAKPKSIKINTN